MVSAKLEGTQERDTEDKRKLSEGVRLSLISWISLGQSKVFQNICLLIPHSHRYESLFWTLSNAKMKCS